MKEVINPLYTGKRLLVGEVLISSPQFIHKVYIV